MPPEDNRKTASPSGIRTDLLLRWCATLLLFWLTWSAFQDLLTVDQQAGKSARTPSFLILVMVGAAFLAWLRRGRLATAVCRSSRFGLAALASGILLHLVAQVTGAVFIDAAAFLITVNGVVAAVWGRCVWLNLWPAVLFTSFLLPVPSAETESLSEFLRSVVCAEAAWYLQAFGQPAIAQGTSVLTPAGHYELAASFCGLQSMVVCLAAASVVAIASHRGLLEKILILFGAFPVAVLISVAHVATFASLTSTGASASDAIVIPVPAAFAVMLVTVLILYSGVRLFDVLFPLVRQPNAGSRVAAKSPGTAGVSLGLPMERRRRQGATSL